MAQPRTRFSKHGKDDPENQMGLERDVMNSVYYLVGGLEHVLFYIIYGMSSFPLTFIFFKMVIAPPTSY
jgi:hypothetical protein